MKIQKILNLIKFIKTHFSLTVKLQNIIKIKNTISSSTNKNKKIRNNTLTPC